MRQIFTSIFVVLAAVVCSAQNNLIANGSFDSSVGWTFVNQYGTDSTVDVNNTPDDTSDDIEAHLACLSVENGTLNIIRPSTEGWLHVGFYTSVELVPGFYSLDFDISWTGIAESWGEVYMGASEPTPNNEYSGDAKILNVLNGWDYGQEDYSGKATATPGALANSQTGVFEITTSGTYYFLYRTGGPNFGTQTIDNFTITSSNQPLAAKYTSSVTGKTATFTDNSVSATSRTWDFGDGNTSTVLNPIHTYSSDGAYKVKLTVSDGSASLSYSSWVFAGSSQNLITNGSFDNDSGWTKTNHYEDTNTGGLVTISDGVATITRTETAAGWAHVGLYTSLNLEPGSYQFDMRVSYEDVSDNWGEVYLGKVEPTPNQDYSGDMPVIKVLNGWSDTKTYSGLGTDSGVDTDFAELGFVEITESATYYLLFRTGGNSYGSSGITVDDFVLFPAANSLGLDEVSSSMFTLYPNPSTDLIYFSDDRFEGKKATLFDALGRKVGERVVNANAIDVSNLKRGNYFIKVEQQTLRLIKQ